MLLPQGTLCISVNDANLRQGERCVSLCMMQIRDSSLCINPCASPCWSMQRLCIGENSDHHCCGGGEEGMDGKRNVNTVQCT